MLYGFPLGVQAERRAVATVSEDASELVADFLGGLDRPPSREQLCLNVCPAFEEATASRLGCSSGMSSISSDSAY